ncbi:hypothetical protein OC861_006173 [Tilletia horrida]|nr:hypothetical protein OC861_006173 [Tilletia horrida]
MQIQVASLALLLPLVAAAVMGEATPIAASSPTATRDEPAAPAPGSASAPPTTPNNATPGLNIPNLAALKACGENCTVKAAKAAGCTNKEDTKCWCKSQKFADSAYKCIEKECKEASPFVFPQYKAGCEADKHEVTFKWPGVTNATSTGNSSTDATPGPTSTIATDNTTTTTGSPGTSSTGSGPKGAAGQGVELALGLAITALSLSVGAALVA